jgi:glycosyltransferase involved in cell wall biosynthesis
MAAMQVQDLEMGDLSWVEAFRKKHRRAPRILHIGNIANNAYLNAKFLNAHGFDCDVICNDYYHIMACPEWEDAEFNIQGLDHFAPDWVNAGSRDFTRPKWFAQGPQILCIEYLIAKRMGLSQRAAVMWRLLGYENGTRHHRKLTLGNAYGVLCERAVGYKRPLELRLRQIAGMLISIVREPDSLTLARKKIKRIAGIPGSGRHFVIARVLEPVVMTGAWVFKHAGQPVVRLLEYWVEAHSRAQSSLMRQVQFCVDKFAATFPDRPDQLTANDCIPYLVTIPLWKKLFSHYDIVQAYATSVVYPLLAGSNSYVAFEHGTLRDFTLADNSISRITSLGYQSANHSLITNGDCLAYAKAIKVEHYTAMIHPIDEVRMAAIGGNYEALHRKYGVKYLFICPLRHDWLVKGTDKYIRALPELATQLNRDFRLIMTRWGAQVGESARLAEELGVADLIAWIEPLSRSQLIGLQKSVDLVFDQIALPHFGATAPQAIAAGVPVIMSYEPASTEWIIPEPAPILSAWTAHEIAQGALTALDPQWLAEYKIRAAAWYDKYHSSIAVVNKLSRVYRGIIESKAMKKRSSHESRRQDAESPV